MKREAFVAFDTSCYTTSVSAVSEGKIVFDKRITLTVPEGAQGLRQSEAVFQHIRNIKTILCEFPEDTFNIAGVSYSEKPCPKEGSYMPVFLAGETAALSFAAGSGAEKFPLTHQHGHIYSAFFGNSIQDGEEIAFHVSGGTLDILKINIQKNIVSEITALGGKLDITCGQLIDRVGVAAGLRFPAGAHIEKEYIKSGVKLPVSVKGLVCNLSGAEEKAKRLLKEGLSPAAVCSAAIDCAAQTLSFLIKNAADITGIKRFIFTGGVICNKIIREKITAECGENGYRSVMADTNLSGDNACGLALAAYIFKKRGG